MNGFKDSTRTVSGHHHWGGGSIGGGTGDTRNRLARGGPVDSIHGAHEMPQTFPKEGDRMHGNALTQRALAPTQELTEHGGKTPLIAKFAGGGKAARHFHVHHHHHAKGGKITTSTKSYRAHEKASERFAEGGHVHDNTSPPPSGPDYKKGGRAKAVRKNAGGALYADGGTVSKLALGGIPMGGTPAASPLGRMALRPQGLPTRAGPPMRRPMAIPGPSPMVRAKGGSTGMRGVAKQEVAKHVATPPPRGHGIK